MENSNKDILKQNHIVKDKSVIFENIILQQSTNTVDFEDARNEWEVIDEAIDPSRSHKCICGQPHLKYLFTIQNTNNGKIIRYVGNDCIAKFKRKDLNAKLSAFKVECRLVKCLTDRDSPFLDWSTDKSLFSVAFINRMYEKNGFPKTAYNRFNADDDRDFLVRMFKKRAEPNEKELKKIKALLARAVVPYLMETKLYKWYNEAPENTMDGWFEDEDELENLLEEASLAEPRTLDFGTLSAESDTKEEEPVQITLFEDDDDAIVEEVNNPKPASLENIPFNNPKEKPVEDTTPQEYHVKELTPTPKEAIPKNTQVPVKEQPVFEAPAKKPASMPLDDRTKTILQIHVKHLKMEIEEIEALLDDRDYSGLYSEE